MNKTTLLIEGDLIRWDSMPKDVYEIRNISLDNCDLVRIVADRPERLNQIYTKQSLVDIQADFDAASSIISLVEFSVCFDCDKKFEGLHFLCSACRELQ